MIKITAYLSMLVLSCAMQIVSGQTKTDTLELEVDKKKTEAFSQDNADVIKELELQKETIIADEKAKLKLKVKEIVKKEEDGEITKLEADKQKEAAAKVAAQNIENRVAIVNNKIELAKRGEPVLDDNTENRTSLVIGSNGIYIKNDKYSNGKKEVSNNRHVRRSYHSFVIAFGLNNVLVEGEGINGSPYQVGGSRFFEIGFLRTTKIFRENPFFRVKYGLALQFNGLNPNDNKYFVEDGDQTILVTHPQELKKTKFRMDNIVVPVFIELGPTKKTGHGFNGEDELFNVGIGGYAGLNYSTRQKLKYREDGDAVKEKLKSDYNTNNFVYGVAAYIGWGDTSLYTKLDLNPIFNDAQKEQYNISFGLRWDLD